MPYQDELHALYSRADALERTLRERLNKDDDILTEFASIKKKVAQLEAGRLPAPKIAALIGVCVGASLLSSGIVAAVISSGKAPVSEIKTPEVPNPSSTALEIPIPRLPPPEYMYRVRSFPSGASVFVNGQEVGRTPTELPFFAERQPVLYKISLRLDGYLEHNTEIVPTGYGEINVKLDPTSPTSLTQKTLSYGQNNIPRWEGSVTSMEGSFGEVRVGTPCVVELDPEDFVYMTLEPEEFHISCGGVRLYSWSKGTGTKTFSKYRQVNQDGVTGLGALVASERGISTAQPEMEMDTLHKKLRLFQANSPAWEINITLDRTTSELQFATKTEPDVYNPIPSSFSKEPELEITNTSGDTKLKAGQSCKVKIQPPENNYRWESNCRAELVCGSWTMRDERNRAVCYLGQDESLSSVVIRSEEQKQTFTLDLKTNEGTLVDSSGDKSWGATLQVRGEIRYAE